MTTLEEIDRHWSLTDVADAHEALDIRQEMEDHVMEHVKAQNGG